MRQKLTLNYSLPDILHSGAKPVSGSYSFFVKTVAKGAKLLSYKLREDPVRMLHNIVIIMSYILWL